jgi:Flp pilus assembly protein TadG
MGYQNPISTSKRHNRIKTAKKGIRGSPILSYLMRNHPRGQDLVEFALVFPLLIFFVIGIVDAGRAFHVLIAISNAAREGVRYGVGPGMDRDVEQDEEFIPYENEIKAAAVQEAGNFNLQLDPGNVTVECPNGCVEEQNLRVIVSYTFTPIFDLFLPSAGLQFVRDMEMMIP